MTLSPRGLGFALLFLGSLQAAAAEDPDASARLPFELAPPFEFNGVWERPATPFVNPIETRNHVNVRIDKVDARSGHVHGTLDLYVRSICYDLVDAPFDGTLDDDVLTLSVEYPVCPLMKPLHLRVWKEADGFHARANWWPISINRARGASIDR